MTTICKPRTTQALTVPQYPTAGPVSPQAPPQNAINVQGSPKHHRPAPTASAPPNMQHYAAPSSKLPFPPSTNVPTVTSLPSTIEPRPILTGQPRSVTPVVQQTAVPLSSSTEEVLSHNISTPQEYSLFNSAVQQPMWRPENESQKPVNFAAVTGGGVTQAAVQPKFIEQEKPKVDVAKAPGYRGTAVCSPVSSKTSSNSTSPPSIPTVSSSGYQNYTEPKSQPLPPIGSNIIHNRPVSQASQNDMPPGTFYANNELPTRSMQHLNFSDNTNMYKGATSSFADTNPILNLTNSDGPLLQSFHPSNSMQHMNFSQSQPQQGLQPTVSMSRLNPKAPDFSSSLHSMPMKQNTPSFNGYPIANQSNGAMYPMGK